MSKMEYNKGKLTPIYVDTEHFTDEDYEMYTENGFALIDGEIYQVEWESRSEDLDEIARATVNSDGTIDFETYHYNGGAYWTEVVEYALERNKSE